jgi:hypothetical protein
VKQTQYKEHDSDQDELSSELEELESVASRNNPKRSAPQPQDRNSEDEFKKTSVRKKRTSRNTTPVTSARSSSAKSRRISSEMTTPVTPGSRKRLFVSTTPSTTGLQSRLENDTSYVPSPFALNNTTRNPAAASYGDLYSMYMGQEIEVSLINILTVVSLLNENTAIETLVNEWLETCGENKNQTLVDLANLVIQVITKMLISVH